MSPRMRLTAAVLGLTLIGGAGPGPAEPMASPQEAAVLNALAANPVTAPYVFRTALAADGRVVLTGRVGTKQAHDVAINVAMAAGPVISDQLVIDTAETLRAAAPPPTAPAAARAVNPAASRAALLAGAAGPLAIPPYGLSTYIYPPPLFGWYDEPFYGFEPPIISYPPWWPYVAARQPIDLSAFGAGPGVAPAAPAGGTTVAAGSTTLGPAIEMTLDPHGVATLRGTVPTLADRVAIGQKVARMPGIVEVVNLLNVAEPAAVAAEAPVAPTPPVPAPNPAPAAGEKPAPALVPAAGGLGPRVARALGRRPELAGIAFQVADGGEGVVTISGRVPSAYEAMLAYRAAEQTPGVRAVIDRLEFPQPDEDRPNPLRARGRPEDVEPYLEAQIRRQVGDLAHIDRVRLQADRLAVRGTVTRDDDRPRVEAILRSMPLLRGFDLEPEFQAE